MNFPYSSILFSFAEVATQEGNSCYVHCQAGLFAIRGFAWRIVQLPLSWALADESGVTGVSRSVAMVIAYLMEAHQMTLRDAVSSSSSQWWVGGIGLMVPSWTIDPFDMEEFSIHQYFLLVEKRPQAQPNVGFFKQLSELELRIFPQLSSTTFRWEDYVSRTVMEILAFPEGVYPLCCGL